MNDERDTRDATPASLEAQVAGHGEPDTFPYQASQEIKPVQDSNAEQNAEKGRSRNPLNGHTAEYDNSRPRNTDITPSGDSDPRIHPAKWLKYPELFVSTLLSCIFVLVLMVAGICYHYYRALRGKERLDVLSKSDVSPYPNLKKLKATTDLRYYALQLGLDLHEYRVQTDDGYVLVLHRLFDPKENDAARDKREPFLLQHGLLSCSGAFLTGGFQSLAYYLHAAGHDVWLGNNRCWFEPMHATMEGNLMSNEDFWDWDVRELGYYDLPCLIDSVLSHKPQHKSLYLVGHLQGCTQSFLMLRNPDRATYHDKVRAFFALAPAIYPGRLFHQRPFLRFMRHRNEAAFRWLFGRYSFLRIITFFRSRIYSTRFFGYMSYVMFSYLFFWNGRKWNQSRKLWHIHFIYNVTFVSLKLMAWWLAEWLPQSFANELQPMRAYKSDAHFSTEADIALQKDDSKTYFPYQQSWFDGLLVVPIVAFICSRDFLVDGKRLASHLQNFEPAYSEQNLRVVELDDYSHLDVVWAADLQERIGKVIVRAVEKDLKEQGIECGEDRTKAKEQSEERAHTEKDQAPTEM